jgi:hypothetical protein
VRTLETIGGSKLVIPDRERITHPQFRRYAGCPVCNLHIRSLASRHAEIAAAGVQEVIVFHSERSLMLDFQGDLPFAAIADPKFALYRDFDVGRMRIWHGLHPRSWRAAYRALTRATSLRGAPGWGEEHMGLPAEFLIAPTGLVLAVNYGQFVDDHWSADELIGLTRQMRAQQSRSDHQ